MNVNLASRTEPNKEFVRASLEELGVEVTADLLEVTPEQLMVYVARTSSERENKWESYEGLIRYLIKHKHWSPFQFAYFCFEVKTSRAISLQIVRHASLDVQQLSQRYMDSVVFEPVELRAEAAQNRQSSSDVISVIVPDQSLVTLDQCLETMVQVRGREPQQGQPYYGSEDYFDFLAAKLRLDQLVFEELRDEAKVAGECARMFLPETTQTTLYLNGSVRSWLSFLNVRLDDHAQKEVRDIANQIADILAVEVPTVTAALDSFNQGQGMFL